MLYEISDPTERIYKFLLANNLVHSAADFSRLMGRSRTYLNTIRLQRRNPSPDAWANLTTGLHRLLKQPLHDQTRAVIGEIIREIHDQHDGLGVTP